MNWLRLSTLGVLLLVSNVIRNFRSSAQIGLYVSEIYSGAITGDGAGEICQACKILYLLDF